jgi:hypothetical protein
MILLIFLVLCIIIVGYIVLHRKTDDDNNGLGDLTLFRRKRELNNLHELPLNLFENSTLDFSHTFTNYNTTSAKIVLTTAQLANTHDETYEVFELDQQIEAFLSPPHEFQYFQRRYEFLSGGVLNIIHVVTNTNININIINIVGTRQVFTHIILYIINNIIKLVQDFQANIGGNPATILFIKCQESMSEIFYEHLDIFKTGEFVCMKLDATTVLVLQHDMEPTKIFNVVSVTQKPYLYIPISKLIAQMDRQYHEPPVLDAADESVAIIPKEKSLWGKLRQIW